mmetsp:Transcript_34147/g.98324  ORF Transcript_34147/g.98324 Transcript_34147/m.98324 type:complete len:227 (-) Transcript_34147:43-723(-)
MTVGHTAQQLQHDPGHVRLIHAQSMHVMSSIDVLGQRTPRAEFHDQVQVLSVLEGLVVADHVWVVRNLEELNLQVQGLRITDFVLGQGLDGNRLPRPPVLRGVHRAEAPLAEGLPHVVEVVHREAALGAVPGRPPPADEVPPGEAPGPGLRQEAPERAVLAVLKLRADAPADPPAPRALGSPGRRPGLRPKGTRSTSPSGGPRQASAAQRKAQALHGAWGGCCLRG